MVDPIPRVGPIYQPPRTERMEDRDAHAGSDHQESPYKKPKEELQESATDEQVTLLEGDSSLDLEC